KGRLNQHLACRLAAAGGLSADNPGKGLDPRLIGDHDIADVELIGPAVERDKLLAWQRAANGQAAFDFLRIKTMQGPGPVVGDNVRDVDERIDWPETNGCKPPLQPCRAWSVAHSFDETQGEKGREMRVLACKVEPHRYRAREIASNWCDGRGL